MRIIATAVAIAFLSGTLLGLSTGCNSPHERMNAPPHGTTEKTSEMQGTFVYMSDNAMLADMSVTDSHFLPHRPQLSTLGEQRVARLAELMNAYGGVIRLSSASADRDLLAKRKEALIKYLAEMDVDTTTEIVSSELPGGRGMDAAEAILIRKSEGMYKAGDNKDASAGTKPAGGLGAAPP